jgi:hypothetical protein
MVWQLAQGQNQEFWENAEKWQVCYGLLWQMKIESFCSETNPQFNFI